VVAVMLVEGHQSSPLQPASMIDSAMTAAGKDRRLVEIFTVATPPSTGAACDYPWALSSIT
jgi:hypothetical protein